MAIPRLDEQGLLPVGLHECTLEEVKLRFGSFQGSERRLRLFAQLRAFFSEAKASELVVCILLDGSFVTGEPEPNDIDLIAVVAGDHDFSGDLLPSQYNVLSKKHVHRKFGFDMLVAREESVEFGRWVEFFQQVRLEPDRRKGILKLRL